MEQGSPEFLDVAGAAERLGVKPETIYAYISRGLLRRVRGGRRRSLLYAAEVERLALKGKPRLRIGPSTLAIASAVTTLGRDRPYYRGRDALALAGTTAYETVAEWLWSGTWPEPDDVAGLWQSHPAAVEASRAAQAHLPPGTLPIDRIQIAVAVLGATDPLRFHLDEAAVTATARRLIAGMVDALPPAAGGTPAEAPSIAAKLWSRLTARRPSPGLLRVLDAALVLLADHELAASTLAARVAASVRADPYAVVATGLGVLAGPMHGGASLGVERLLRNVSRPELVASVLGEHLRRNEQIPGVGHPVYAHGDGRAHRLLALLAAADPGSERVAVAQHLVAELQNRRLGDVNIDFALGSLADTCGMTDGAGQAIFAVARSAGWVAHALEEYRHPTPLRPRSLSLGPSPAPDTPS